MQDFKTGHRVEHKKDPGVLGTIVKLEDDHAMIQWDDAPAGDLDFQWLSKLYVISENKGGE